MTQIEMLAEHVADVLGRRILGVQPLDFDNYTPIDKEIILLLGQGLSHVEIAKKMNYAVGYIGNRVTAIRRRSGIGSTVSLAQYGAFLALGYDQQF